MSSDNLYTEEDFTVLFTAWKAGTAVDVVFDIAKEAPVENPDGTVVPENGWTPKGGANGKGLKGKAYITNISVNAPDGDNATYSVTFAGSGELSNYTQP